MSQVIGQPVTTALGSDIAARVLVVDDEQHICDICSRALQRGGYQVVAVNDPHLAVKLLHEDAGFDLLLTDIKMPTMSGLDLAYIARERDPAIAIIIMTGFASLENMHQSVQRGVADFLAKPFDLDQLRLAVDQALHKRAILQDSLRLRTLEQLLSNSEALSATLALPELVRIVLRVMIKQSGCRGGFLLLAEDALRFADPVASSPDAVLLDAGRALISRAMDEQQALASSALPVARLDNISCTYAVAVPLRAQGETCAVLLLCSDEPSLVRPGVQEGVMLLANHAGAALRNAVLYSQLDEAFQRSQGVDRIKSEIISIASHELRTPLSLVLGYTMMVRDQSAGDHRDYLQRVMEGAQRIKEIVDDMVSLRHIETGETQMVLVPVVVQDLVRQTIEHLGLREASGDHIITADLPSDPLVFLSDREKLFIILNHLLSNAVKFTPRGGKIVVRAFVEPQVTREMAERFIIPPASTPSSLPWLVLTVSDTGIGIPAREQTRIFDRFYQIADSLTRNRGGTGLGLALVRELVAALGGALWLVSREQAGSAFYVALPFRLPSSTPAV
jgi:signal transduction histidine kinase